MSLSAIEMNPLTNISVNQDTKCIFLDSALLDTERDITGEEC